MSPWFIPFSRAKVIYIWLLYLTEQVYWAKDLIFLVTEHEQLGAQAWLQAYHRTQSGAGVLDHGDLEGRAGAIQVLVSGFSSSFSSLMIGYHSLFLQALHAFFMQIFFVRACLLHLHVTCLS